MRKRQVSCRCHDTTVPFVLTTADVVSQCSFVSYKWGTGGLRWFVDTHCVGIGTELSAAELQVLLCILYPSLLCLCLERRILYVCQVQ